jgi:hypothetical protein
MVPRRLDLLIVAETAQPIYPVTCRRCIDSVITFTEISVILYVYREGQITED